MLENGLITGAAFENAGRSTHAFGLIETALAAAGCAREDIGCLAIGVGPGSYHGIRAAIALAQGWQLGAQVKLLAVSSVECLAREAAKQGLYGTVHFLLDAQRNEFYHATYKITDAAVECVSRLRILTMVEAREIGRLGEPLAGPDITRWFPSGTTLVPQAETLGEVAMDRTDYLAGEQLEPIYLREPGFVKAPPPRVVPPAAAD